MVSTLRVLFRCVIFPLVLTVTLTGCWFVKNNARISDGIQMADPTAIKVGTTPYVITTGNFNFNGQRFPIWQLNSSWGMPSSSTDAMPDSNLPQWVSDDPSNFWGFWAPDISKSGSTYYLYFTARRPGQGNLQLCIGVGWSSSPAGPYTYSSTPVRKSNGNWLCDVIDPNVVQYGSRRYLMFNGNGKIQAARLATNHTELDTNIIDLIAPEAGDGGVVENPSMAQFNSSYDGTAWHLTYSHHNWKCDDYATWIAECPNGPTAPCFRDPTNSWNGSRRLEPLAERRQGAGGLDFVYGSNSEVVYHAWNGSAPTCSNAERFFQARSGWKGNIDWAKHWSGYFVDDDNSSHEADIDWLQARGYVSGCDGQSPPKFCPSEIVVRSTAALFIQKAFDLPIPNVSCNHYFTDVCGLSSAQRNAIHALKLAGILNGCTTTTACPGNSVTRGEIAIMLSRALGLPSIPVSQQTWFTDIPAGTFYREAAHQLRNAGITTGCAHRTFCGENPVPREQMATFIKRSID